LIEYIKNIGQAIREINGELELVDLWQKDNKDFDNLLIINLDEKIEMNHVQFTKDAYRQSLLYQQGNGMVGAGIKIEKFKDDKKTIDKLEKKIKKSLEFIEIDTQHLPKIANLITTEVREGPNETYFVLFKKNNKYPLELCREKYEKTIKETYLNKQTSANKCHLCSHQGLNYDTVLFNCYTNDKDIYTNTKGLNYNVCENCLYDLLNGRKYINENLRTFWAGSEVMFLPHIFDEDIKEIYEENKVDGDGNFKKLLENIRTNEDEVLECVSKTTTTDIIFFTHPRASSEWKIEYSIRGVMPSRFTGVSQNLGKYSSSHDNRPLNFYTIMKYLCLSDGKGGSHNKDRFRLLDIVFHGKKYSRNIFFNRVMKQYKQDYFNGKPYMSNIHRIYNFICDCGCLEKGWNYMICEEGRWKEMKYTSLEEFFNKNEKFFDTGVKKAWFILGKVYNSLIYYSKKYKAGSDGNVKEEKSHLEQSFFFGRKFDYNTFIYFSNMCSEKLLKYRNYNPRIKEEMTMAKEYMQRGKGKLNNDEAKYIFFWGMDMYFQKGDEE
jgi:CRISPR-associated protein Csh1